jgi:hypothetical protein
MAPRRASRPMVRHPASRSPSRPFLAAALLIGVLAATACIASSDRRPAPEPLVQQGSIEDLRQALARWHRVPATVVYRTDRQRPGLPLSAHQCLRGFVDDRPEDIPIGLAKCDPAGVARLVWDPPARWRLEVTEANRTISATVVGRRAVLCDPADGTDARCRRRSSDRLVAAFPFRELVVGVRSVLRELGIAPTGPVTVTHRLVGDTPADCYERAAAGSSVKWCFGRDGILLALELRAQGRAPTLVEAERVSSEVRSSELEALSP